MLRYISVSTKKGSLRLLMATATDGDGSLTSSFEELMVDVVMRLILDDLCLVMQAARCVLSCHKSCKLRYADDSSSSHDRSFHNGITGQWCKVIVW